MATIFIDGKEYEVGEGRNVLQAALDHKLDLPYFCWHPAMGSVGACRLCAVKHYRDENDEHGRLVMGCMTPATEGTRIAIAAPDAAQFRRSVVEWLMINHPHDCPVCDEGGECHLQDMTVMTGHAHRRYRGKKRTYRNQYLGPLIHHEMNRCIQCYRCVRFYCDHSGGDDLGAFASRNRVYFGRVEDGVLESPFAGNLVEVCPTGVFTDKTLRRHYTRKWDLQQAPTVCTHCGLGCNTLMGARYDSARRVTSRYNSEVNGYWLCDRGRFGYEHLNAEDRLLASQRPRRSNDEMNASDELVWREAYEAVAAAAAAGTLAGVGSPRASLETNFAVRTLVGAGRFCSGTAEPERRLISGFAEAARRGAFHVPSLAQIETADVVLVLGTDATNEAPLLDLALYRAHAAGNAAIYFVGLGAGRLQGFATALEHADAEATAIRVEAIAAALRGSGDDPLATALSDSRTPLIVTGTQHRSRRLFDAALDLIDAAGAARGAPPWFAMAVAEANTMGVNLLDDGVGLSVADLVDAIEAARVTTLVVAENDIFARFADTDRLAAALQRLNGLIVLDHMVTPTGALASHTLPVAAAAESSGTLVNNEGRMQRFFQVLRPAPGVVPAWSVARDLMGAVSARGVAGWRHFEEVTAALEAASPVFVGATTAAPPAGFRQQRQRIPRMSQRYSGRNATIEADALNRGDAGRVAEGTDELPVVGRLSEDPETPFAFSMEGFSGHTPPALMTRVWSPGWNSNEAINQFQIEVGGPLHGGDPGVRIFSAGGAAASAGASGDSVANGVAPTASNSAAVRADDAAGPSRSDDIRTDTRVSPSKSDAIGTDNDANAAAKIPDAMAVSAGDESFLVCAAAEIFASEETSRRAPALAELAPDCYLRLHPQRAAALGLRNEEARRIDLEGGGLRARFEATVILDDALPTHVIVIPAGFVETRWWQAPIRMRLRTGEALP